MPRCSFNHSFTSTLLMHKELVTSHRGSLWYQQIYQNPDLPVQCIKLKTIFLICAFVACRPQRETQVLHSSVTGPGPRHAKQAGHLGPLAPVRTMGGGPGGAPQACLVNVCCGPYCVGKLVSAPKFNELARQPRLFSLSSSYAMQLETCSWGF